MNNGELFAYLGVNGAGKSTTINVLCGILAKDSGNILVNGMDIDKTSEYKKDIGVVY